MKVGIDLSSSNTGVIILENNNKLVDKGVFNLWKDNKINFDEIVKLSNFIYDAWLAKANCDIEKLETIDIGVELADFKNANYTNRFNRICGALEFDFWEAPYDYECKLFNSNEWQILLLGHYKDCITTINEIDYWTTEPDCDGNECDIPIYNTYYLITDKSTSKVRSDLLPNTPLENKECCEVIKIEENERTLRKTLSRLFTKQHCFEYTENWTEDECDAYCIAYFLPQLRDRTQMHQEVKIKKVQAKKSKVQELREKLRAYDKTKKLYEKVNHYKDLANVKKLTKAQQRALEKAINELEELKNEN